LRLDALEQDVQVRGRGLSEMQERLAHAILPIAGKGPSDWSYSWIPVAAPIAGGIVGAALYSFVGF